MGILPIREAINIAAEHDLDLIEVAPGAAPPVCKIMDYGKYRYQMSKKHSTKHKTIVVKEVKMRPQINEHDLDLKIRNIKRFIEEGNKAKVTIFFRGREIVHASLSRKFFDKIIQEISGMANIEQSARLEGNHMTMVLSPKTG